MPRVVEDGVVGPVRASGMGLTEPLEGSYSRSVFCGLLVLPVPPLVMRTRSSAPTAMPSGAEGRLMRVAITPVSGLSTSTTAAV